MLNFFKSSLLQHASSLKPFKDAAGKTVTNLQIWPDHNLLAYFYIPGSSSKVFYPFPKPPIFLRKFQKQWHSILSTTSRSISFPISQQIQNGTEHHFRPLPLCVNMDIIIHSQGGTITAPWNQPKIIGSACLILLPISESLYPDICNADVWGRIPAFVAVMILRGRGCPCIMDRLMYAWEHE